MNTDFENVFLDRIDANFPYEDRQECLRLIDEASNMSTNVMFAVIEEICRIHHDEKKLVGINYLFSLLKVVESKFEHPLKEMVLDTAYKMINEEYLSVDEVINRMLTIKKYPWQFHALSILYFSCDDVEGKLEPVWDDILSEWRKNGT